MRARVLLFFCAAVLPIGAFAACFPDFQVSGSSSGASGGPSDGAAGGDGTIPGQDGSSSGSDGSSGGPGDGSSGGLPDGGGTDGSSGGIDAGSMILIPQSGPGGFAYHISTSSSQVIITHDFYLDAKEATVARFRDWVNAAMPLPCETGTECTLDPGGPHQNEMRWQTSWNLKARSDNYKNPSCNRTDQSFNAAPTYNGTANDVPINCINWYQAVAFCWFDGQKRVATQIEWQYTASGRGRNRTYPWGDTPAPTDCSHAVWEGSDGGSLNFYNGCGFPLAGGSAPAGASFDGVLDMAGSVYEWTWDDPWSTLPAVLPNDYSGNSIDGGIFSRISRGGGFTSAAVDVTTQSQNNYSVDAYVADIGVRCAKTKP